jgi:hypothetical protein
MLGRLLRGSLVGLLAAYGARAIGLDDRTIAIAFAIPVVVSAIDVFVREVYSVCALFGIGCLLVAFTPLGNVVQRYLPVAAKIGTVNEAGPHGSGPEQGPVQSATAASNNR